MFDFNPIFEFSRFHCVAICAFLVPANLLAALQTLIYVGLRRPQAQIWQAAGFASLLALAMVLHVLTWFLIGVVMAPTYILLWLGSSCLCVNLWAVGYPQSLQRLLVTIKFTFLKLRQYQ